MTEGKGVDMALESSGGESLEQTLRCLASFGRLVVFGAASGRSAMLSPQSTESFLYAPAPNQTLVGFNVGGWFMERPAAAAVISPPALPSFKVDDLGPLSAWSIVF